MFLYAEGEPADSFFFLESGLVRIVRRGPRDEPLLLCLVRPGEIIGERAMLPDQVRISSAHVVRESVIYVIPAQALSRLSARDPGVWRWLTQVLAQRLQEMERRVELLALHTVEQRIIGALIELAEIYGSAEQESAGISVPLSQKQLADLVCATRETTSGLLNSLERRGLVRIRRCQTLIPSLEALRRATPKRPRRAGAR